MNHFRNVYRMWWLPHDPGLFHAIAKELWSQRSATCPKERHVLSSAAITKEDWSVPVKKWLRSWRVSVEIAPTTPPRPLVSRMKIAEIGGSVVRQDADSDVCPDWEKFDPHPRWRHNDTMMSSMCFIVDFFFVVALVEFSNLSWLSSNRRSPKFYTRLVRRPYFVMVKRGKN